VIGSLNQRATIAAKTFASDGGGGFDDGWATVATVWVRVEPKTGNDVFGPDRKEAQTRLRLTLRRNTVIAPGQRIAIGSRALTIRNVIDEGPQAQMMTLLCEEMP
jgi:SPP1 family predicted phage head-tail adaptor